VKNEKEHNALSTTSAHPRDLHMKITVTTNNSSFLIYTKYIF
jgi:hypothetical protein